MDQQQTGFDFVMAIDAIHIDTDSLLHKLPRFDRLIWIADCAAMFSIPVLIESQLDRDLIAGERCADPTVRACSFSQPAARIRSRCRRSSTRAVMLVNTVRTSQPRPEPNI